MLDMDICIYAIKNRSDYLLTKLRANAAAGIGISSITAPELHFGVAKTHSEKNAKALERAGTPIGPLDTQIAAHARQLGVMFVTNNVREFVCVKPRINIR
jgi:tRNA(fMet)-specific endonuclease VapC